MARATTVSYTVSDVDDQTTTRRFYLGSAINTIAGIETAAQSVLEALSACITGDITQVQVTLPLDPSGWTLAPSTSSSGVQDRQVGAEIILRNIDNIRASITLPTFDPDKGVAGSNVVDDQDADIAALIAAMMGTTFATAQNIEVTTFDAAFETFAGKRR